MIHDYRDLRPLWRGYYINDALIQTPDGMVVAQFTPVVVGCGVAVELAGFSPQLAVGRGPRMSPIAALQVAKWLDCLEHIRLREDGTCLTLEDIGYLVLGGVDGNSERAARAYEDSGRSSAFESITKFMSAPYGGEDSEALLEIYTNIRNIDDKLNMERFVDDLRQVALRGVAIGRDLELCLESDGHDPKSWYLVGNEKDTISAKTPRKAWFQRLGRALRGQ